MARNGVCKSCDTDVGELLQFHVALCQCLIRRGQLRDESLLVLFEPLPRGNVQKRADESVAGAIRRPIKYRITRQESDPPPIFGLESIFDF